MSSHIDKHTVIDLLKDNKAKIFNNTGSAEDETKPYEAFMIDGEGNAVGGLLNAFTAQDVHGTMEDDGVEGIVENATTQKNTADDNKSEAGVAAYTANQQALFDAWQTLLNNIEA